MIFFYNNVDKKSRYVYLYKKEVIEFNFFLVK